MTDIIAEIAESGLRTKNPICDISLDDHEDTDAAVVRATYSAERIPVTVIFISALQSL